MNGNELRVETDRDQIVLSREDSLAERRRRATRAAAGTMTGAYEPEYLDRLRDEWR